MTHPIIDEHVRDLHLESTRYPCKARYLTASRCSGSHHALDEHNTRSIALPVIGLQDIDVMSFAIDTQHVYVRFLWQVLIEEVAQVRVVTDIVAGRIPSSDAQR